ncbi:hypothetical protein [Haliscomenobacter sp.]|uniref:hypothetical protein n=1 Tax=Haliscomenobacter sp. TaxID=2717303 RepID=UPI0035946589
MKGFLAITTTIAFLGMFAATTSAQKVTGISTTPGYSNSQPSTPGINSANRRYDAPRVDYRTPPNSGGRYDRNEPYRHDRDDRDRRGDDDRRGGYGSRDDDRRRYEHRDNDRNCSCDKCHHHHDDRYDSRSRSTSSSRDRDRGYVDYRDRDRNERSRGSSCPPKGRGKYGRD